MVQIFESDKFGIRQLPDPLLPNLVLANQIVETLSIGNFYLVIEIVSYLFNPPRRPFSLPSIKNIPAQNTV